MQNDSNVNGSESINGNNMKTGSYHETKQGSIDKQSFYDTVILAAFLVLNDNVDIALKLYDNTVNLSREGFEGIEDKDRVLQKYCLCCDLLPPLNSNLF